MPALPTLLLFAKSIDTNNNFSRIVFDSWIEARFPNPIEGYFGFEIFSYLNLEVFRANEKEKMIRSHSITTWTRRGESQMSAKVHVREEGDIKNIHMDNLFWKI